MQHATGFGSAQRCQRHGSAEADFEVAIGYNHAVIAGQLKYRGQCQAAIHQKHSVRSGIFKGAVGQRCSATDGVGLAIPVCSRFQPAFSSIAQVGFKPGRDLDFQCVAGGIEDGSGSDIKVEDGREYSGRSDRSERHIDFRCHSIATHKEGSTNFH